MSLPALAEWDATRDALHQIAQVMGAIRVACSDPMPNDLHFSLDVTAQGISTAKMRCGALCFDFETLQFTFARGECCEFRLDAAGHSQKSLMRRLLADFGHSVYGIQPSMKHITGDAPFEIDQGQAIAYWEALDAVYTALARFRAKLSGFMTPLVLWPHHFDLGFIWFAAGADEHNDPQIAYGFAPASPGLERPYLYAYAWSKPTGYLELDLPPPAQAVSDGYTGLYAAYDALREEDQFDAVVEKMLLNYNRLATAKLST